MLTRLVLIPKIAITIVLWYNNSAVTLPADKPNESKYLLMTKIKIQVAPYPRHV